MRKAGTGAGTRRVPHADEGVSASQEVCEARTKGGAWDLMIVDTVGSVIGFGILHSRTWYPPGNSAHMVPCRLGCSSGFSPSGGGSASLGSQTKSFCVAPSQGQCDTPHSMATIWCLGQANAVIPVGRRLAVCTFGRSRSGRNLDPNYCHLYTQWSDYYVVCSESKVPANLVWHRRPTWTTEKRAKEGEGR